MSRREEISSLLRHVGLALDDDDIAGRLGINRHYVNRICRELSMAGLTTRFEGPTGKLVNSWSGHFDVGEERPSAAMPPSVGLRPRMSRTARSRSNIEALIGDFSGHLSRFERSNAFSGPSLYFHAKAIARRLEYSRVDDLLADDLFFEYVYAVLPAWGMHRMGTQAAKVGDFESMVGSFRSCADEIELLWDVHITDVAEGAVAAVAEQVWRVLGSLQVSTSATKIVAGSKALHHVLPSLVPPIDRQYTFRFFTGQRNLASSDQKAFLEWFPYFAEIGSRAAAEIQDALDRGGVMATGAAKVIDNAIIGFMRGEDGDEASSAWLPQ